MSKVQTTDRALYTAEAHVTGGRVQGHGSTSDGAPEVELRTPTAMGGEGGGTNPEQLFSVGYAACFESAPASRYQPFGRAIAQETPPNERAAFPESRLSRKNQAVVSTVPIGSYRTGFRKYPASG
jgi:organic hydroperoxide reductase OsmC/OhrA